MRPKERWIVVFDEKFVILDIVVRDGMIDTTAIDIAVLIVGTSLLGQLSRNHERSPFFQYAPPVCKLPISLTDAK